jgi:hypothetical protein
MLVGRSLMHSGRHRRDRSMEPRDLWQHVSQPRGHGGRVRADRLGGSDLLEKL